MNYKMMQPSLETLFQIDWEWFKLGHIDAKNVVQNQLSYKWRQRFDNGLEIKEVDYINPDTGEVSQTTNMHEVILSECQWEPDYITRDMPLLQSVLRLFLANNNQPMSVAEIARRLERHDSQIILQVLTVGPIENGIIPIIE